MTPNDIESHILVLLKGLPMSDINENTKNEINSLTESIRLKEILLILKTKDDLKLRIYFTILISKVQGLNLIELEEVSKWCSKELEIPEMDWIWYLDEYQMTKPAYNEQLIFKTKINNTLLIVRELMNRKMKIELLEWKLSWFVMSGLPWTNNEINSNSIKLINELEIDKEELIQLVFEDFKVLSKSDKITSAGYSKISKVNNGLKPKLANYFNEDSRIVFKKKRVRSISTIYYLFDILSEKEIKDNWWMISPSILNILDDHDGSIKLIGVIIFSKLLDRVEADFFRLTQIGSVYKESMLPLLTYLPKLTPTKLSVEILKNTYSTLIKLFKINDKREEYINDLLDLLNSNIFATLNSVRDNFEILIVIVNEIIIIIDQLKLHTLKTLPRLLFHIGNILADPFIDSSQELFEITLRCLISIEVNCWPRLFNHRYDILGMISIAYKRDNKTENIIELFSEIIMILQQVIKNDTEADYEEFINEIQKICDHDESLFHLYNRK